MKFFKIAKRGPDKFLSHGYRLSATLKSGTTHKAKPTAIRVVLWLLDPETEESTHKVELTPEEAASLRDFLNGYDFG